MKKLFAVVMAVLTSLGLAWAQTWNHDPVSPIGPLHWGTVTPPYATCGDGITGEAGMKQSPIHIVPDNALAASFSAPLFKYKPTPLKIENRGHSVEMPCDPTSYLYAGSQPTDVYQLARFHFHAPGEHTINVRDDAELHLSHTNVIELRLLPARSSNRPRRRRLRWKSKSWESRPGTRSGMRLWSGRYRRECYRRGLRRE